MVPVDASVGAHAVLPRGIQLQSRFSRALPAGRNFITGHFCLTFIESRVEVSRSEFLNTLYTEHDTVAVTARLGQRGFYLKSQPASGHHEVSSTLSYSLKLNGRILSLNGPRRHL